MYHRTPQYMNSCRYGNILKTKKEEKKDRVIWLTGNQQNKSRLSKL